MQKSAAYIMGAIDALVESGAMSPAYAAGVADVLVKDASVFFWPDTDKENFRDAWDDFWEDNKNNPDIFRRNAKNNDPERIRMTGEQAKKILRQSRHWWTELGGKTGDALGSFFGWLGNKFDPSAPSMSWDEMKKLYTIKQNRRDLTHLRRLEDEGTDIPQALYGALQDRHVKDMRDAWKTIVKFTGLTERDAKYGYNLNDAVEKFRTVYGKGSMRAGYHDPIFDKPERPKPPSVRTDPRASMYGSEDRARLFSRDFRSSLGYD